MVRSSSLQQGFRGEQLFRSTEQKGIEGQYLNMGLPLFFAWISLHVR